jgi:hypothetical protein
VDLKISSLYVCVCRGVGVYFLFVSHTIEVKEKKQEFYEQTMHIYLYEEI